MKRLSTLQNRLNRISDQVTIAQDQISKIDTELEENDARLTIILAQIDPDQAKVDAIEEAKADLSKNRTLLERRVGALQNTMPKAQTAIDEAMLEDALERHPKLIEDVNKALSSWRKKAATLEDLQKLGEAVLAERTKLVELVSEIRYLSALLGKSEVRLPDADHLNNDDVMIARRRLQSSFQSEIDPYSGNSWDIKLKALQEEREEEKRAIRREKHHELAKAAGW